MSDRIEQARCRGPSLAIGALLFFENEKEPDMTNPAAGMPCPVCTIPLVMSERQGVEIDYCPQCRGVWLDRGELDKIVERAAGESQAPAPPPRQQQRAEGDYREQWQGDRHQQQGERPDHDNRRRSFFEDLFD
jgi:hypothetical protein